MSVNDSAQQLEFAARHAAMVSDAIYICPYHSEVTISRGDDQKNSRAYAIGATMVNNEEIHSSHKEMRDAIHTEIDTAADGSCPACDTLRDA